jgi:hypothetical protein
VLLAHLFAVLSQSQSMGLLQVNPCKHNTVQDIVTYKFPAIESTDNKPWIESTDNKRPSGLGRGPRPRPRQRPRTMVAPRTMPALRRRRQRPPRRRPPPGQRPPPGRRRPRRLRLRLGRPLLRGRGRPGGGRGVNKTACP